MQDTWAAADGQELYLSYGAVVEGEAAALQIGNEIVDALQRFGLRTDWDGSWSKRIGVQLNWQRRRSEWVPG
jgi:hypothetical protein